MHIEITIPNEIERTDDSQHHNENKLLVEIEAGNFIICWISSVPELNTLQNHIHYGRSANANECP